MRAEVCTRFCLISIYNDLNMTKIESRPIPEQPFEYRFFVDFEGNLADAAVENAILGIKRGGCTLENLGKLLKT